MSSLQEYRDEFEWEREIRKDDERVNSYLHELPDFIDLPYEDAVIYKKMQRRPELVPKNGEWQDFMHSFDEEADDMSADMEFPGEDWMKREGADIFVAASKLACELPFLFAEEKNNENAVKLMQISCLLGKIMARSSDIIHLEPGELPAFRIAFGKRFLSDLNLAVGLFRSLEPSLPYDESITEIQISKLYEIRTLALSLIGRARADQNGGKKK